MRHFDWRTDEEKGWEERTAPDQAPATSAWPGLPLLALARRRWRPLAAILLMAVATSLLSVRGLALRVQAVESAAREQVLVTHGVLLDAAARSDAELYLTLLGGTRAWRQAQLAALESDVLYERRAMRLIWQRHMKAESELALAPDLQTAVVTSTLRYVGYIGNGSYEEVGLRHLFHYERDGIRWRLVPAEGQLVDGWVNYEDLPIEAVYPRRDRAISERLLQDIQSALKLFCDSQVSCPSSLSLQFQFETNREALSGPRIWFNAMRWDSYGLAFPAPSLVGLPVDQASYRAWRNGYLHATIDLLFDRLVRGVGGASSALHDARYRAMLVELDLMAWPPAKEEAPGEVAVHGDILALCAESPGPGTSLWRYDAGGGDWHRELGGRNLLQMMALNGAPGVLLREQHETERRTAEPQPDIIWWGDGRELALFDGYHLGTSFAASPSFLAANLEGQSLWIYLGKATNCNGRSCNGVVVRAEPTVWSPDGKHTLFQRELEGSRSPPAADDLLWLGDGNGEALARLEEGAHPFWLDDATFGYLVVPDGRAPTFPFEYELVIRRLEGGGLGSRRQVKPDILGSLPQDEADATVVDEMGIIINQAFADPANRDVVYLLSARFTSLLSSVAMPQAGAYLFAVNAQSGEVTVRVPNEVAHQTIVLPQVSAYGRWLAYLANAGEVASSTIVVHDLSAEPRQAIAYAHDFAIGPSSFSAMTDGSAPYDWSEESGQLLILQHGELIIVDPAGWEARRITPPNAGCAHAAWAN